MSASLKRMDDPIAIGWIKENRHTGAKEPMVRLNQKLRGYFGYYRITLNIRKLNSYYEQTKRKLHKWLNRGGGKQCWDWEKIIQLTNGWIRLLKPKIYHSYV